MEVFNLFHKKFHLVGDEEKQIALADSALHRFGLVNPMAQMPTMWGEVDIDDPPAKNDEIWTSFPLKDLEILRNHLPIPIPKLTDETPLVNMCCGHYQYVHVANFFCS